MSGNKNTIKLFNCDLNWVHFERPVRIMRPSMANDWAFIDPEEYLNWHLEFGNNAIYCQAYVFSGYSFYPTKLGPVAPGPGSELLPRLYELAKKDNIPFWSYFCVNADLFISNVRDQWVIPNSRNEEFPHGFLAPESPWTELLCKRIEEFLTDYKVDWILFDWFSYGSLSKDAFPLQSAWFVDENFKKIMGKEAPEDISSISEDDNITYQREVLGSQFYRIKDVIQKTSKNTKIMFNVPYFKAYDPRWIDHPMINESDGLFSECTNEEVMDWLISIKKQDQRLMTTIGGLYFNEEIKSDVNSWKKWYEKGCDFFGYAWGTPPDFRPHEFYSDKIKIVRRAFKEID